MPDRLNPRIDLPGGVERAQLCLLGCERRR